MSYGLDDLVGKTLVSVVFDAANNERIGFICTDGTLVYESVGDCCSVSWIEHITVPTDITGAAVISVGNEEMDVVDDDGDTIRYYQESVATPKGEIIIEFRNRSNGYYRGRWRHGGWLERVK